MGSQLLLIKFLILLTFVGTTLAEAGKVQMAFNIRVIYSVSVGTAVSNLLLTAGSGVDRILLVLYYLCLDIRSRNALSLLSRGFY